MPGSIIEQEMILREKISNKIHLMIHFKENGFWKSFQYIEDLLNWDIKFWGIRGQGGGVWNFYFGYLLVSKILIKYFHIEFFVYRYY